MKSKSNKKPRILATAHLHPDAQSLLRHLGTLELYRNRSELLRKLPGCDALVCLLTDPIDDALLARAPGLQAVGNVAVGVNNIDLPACARRQVKVVNTPDVLTRATAELALALLLAASKRIPEGERLCRSGRWKGWAPDLLLGLELKDRRAVVVGRGRIGKETGRLFSAIGLKVEWITRADSEAMIQKKLAGAQVLSLHLPLTPETRHWLNAERLKLLPTDSILINTSRGPVVEEKALIHALRSGRIFSAGLDVFENEPAIPRELRALPNCVLLPHLGSATVETRRAMALLAAQGVAQVLSGKAPSNLVKWKR